MCSTSSFYLLGRANTRLGREQTRYQPPRGKEGLSVHHIADFLSSFSVDHFHQLDVIMLLPPSPPIITLLHHRVYRYPLHW